MESDRPGRSSLACGRGGRAPGQHRGMAAGLVVPRGLRARGAIVLDPVPARGHLEVVVVHPGGAHPRHGPLAAVGRAAGVSSLGVQTLRRIVGAVAKLRGELVREVTVRSDLRQLKVALESGLIDRKSTRLNSSHANISYAVFCLKKKITSTINYNPRRQIVQS